jgi:hypothetical protein
MDQSSVNMVYFTTIDTLSDHILLQHEVAVCPVDELSSGELNARINLS